jgi:hypothetical protein
VSKAIYFTLFTARAVVALDFVSGLSSNSFPGRFDQDRSAARAVIL